MAKQIGKGGTCIKCRLSVYVEKRDQENNF